MDLNRRIKVVQVICGCVIVVGVVALLYLLLYSFKVVPNRPVPYALISMFGLALIIDALCRDMSTEVLLLGVVTGSLFIVSGLIFLVL